MSSNTSVLGRTMVERFAVNTANAFSHECLVVCLLPWSQGRPPPGILASESGKPFAVDAIVDAIASRHTVLVPATFETVAEEEAAHRILPQFTSRDNLCVFLVQLVSDSTRVRGDQNELILRRHEAMLATGVDDVFMDPDPEPTALRRTINHARATWHRDVHRTQLILDAEPDPVTAENLRVIQDRHQRLLWESIPRALMPRFARLDRKLPESGHSVGNYRLLRRFRTIAGTVLQALDSENTPAAIKVIDKAMVCTPGELEGLYREFRFTSQVVRHPNVTKCLGMMHSSARVYLIFEFAGNQNLLQVAMARPQQRLDGEEALECFNQIGSALAHCHSLDVCHRNICLQHVVINDQPKTGTACHYKLVDFHSAMVARGQITSRAICGCLPYIAPEMAVGGPYVPRMADYWSIGVVLLEMAGGVSSMSHAVPECAGEEADLSDAAGAIQMFFEMPTSHQRALSLLGAVHNAQILTKLQSLLVSNPESRSQLNSLL